MALRYCSLHGRVFRLSQQCWIPFPEEKIQEIKAYDTLLRTTQTEACFLRVIETGCDTCVAAFRQMAQIRSSRDGLRPGER
jgi:hypothetical protein